MAGQKNSPVKNNRAFYLLLKENCVFEIPLTVLSARYGWLVLRVNTRFVVFF